MSNFEQRSFIYNFDILSGTPNIFISGHKNFSIIYGLIVATPIILADLLYAIYAFWMFLFDREMTIIELKDNFTAKNVSIPANEFLFAFNVFNKSLKFEFVYGKEVNLKAAEDYSISTLETNYTVIFYYVNPENDEIQNKYYLETEPCEIGRNIDKNLVDKYNFTNYKNYLCISWKNNHDIIISNTYTTYIAISVSLKMENEDGFYNQKIFANDTTYLSNYSYLDFQLYIQNDIISNKNKTHPIKYRKYFYNEELISVGNLERKEIISNYIDYSSDSGIIIKKKKNYNGISIDSFKSKSLSTGSLELGKNMLYYEFNYVLNADSIETYERTYVKLPAILSDITGVFTTLLTLGQVLVAFFCKNYLEMQVMTKFINSKIFNKTTQKNIIKLDEINTKRELKKEMSNDLNQIGSNIENSKKCLDNNINLNLISSNQKNEPKKNFDVSIYNKAKKNIPFETKMKFLSMKSFCLFHFILSIFWSRKINKTKIIEKITKFFESSLSVEQIIERKMILEMIYEIAKKKYDDEYNLQKFMKIRLEKDNELNELLEKEIQKLDS